MKYKHIKPILGPLNFLLFQWFTIRLFVEVEGDSLASTINDHIVRRMYFRHGIKPLTGWWTPYYCYSWNNFNREKGKPAQVDLWNRRREIKRKQGE